MKVKYSFSLQEIMVSVGQVVELADYRSKTSDNCFIGTEISAKWGQLAMLLQALLSLWPWWHTLLLHFCPYHRAWGTTPSLQAGAHSSPAHLCKEGWQGNLSSPHAFPSLSVHLDAISKY